MDRSSWFAELFAAMKSLSGALFASMPAAEAVVLAIVCGVLVFIAERSVCRACKAPERWRSVAVLGAGFVLMLLGAALVAMSGFAGLGAQWAGALGLFLVAGLPLSCAIHRVSWISALLMWAVVLLVAGSVYGAGVTLSRTIHRGARRGELYQQQQERLEQLPQEVRE